jgi:hypothetical protein
VEALILTAAEVVCAGPEGLSRRQLELAHRAYALLLAEDDDTADDEEPGEGGRS